MFIKLTFYAFLLLQICCIVIINAGPVKTVTRPTTQVEKIKAARSGMTSCSIKSKLCHAGGRVLEAVGLEDTAPKLYQKSRENQVKMKGHVEDLRAATKKRYFS